MFFSFLILCLFIFPVKTYAFNDHPEIVRIGYYENEVFEEGASPDAVKTGYAYEYYRKLSEYTGWNYEYVYGSFGDLYDMLLSGDIDLLAGLAKREDRLDIIGYPTAPMGNEVYTLVKHDDDTSVSFSPSTVSGKKIGVLKSAIYDILVEYLDENAIVAEIVSFDDYESLFTAFDTKEVDILAAEGDGAYGRDHAEVICTFGTSDYYLCVNKKRPDLLDDLEEAQSALSMDEPNYISFLQSKYYSASVSSHTFSNAEREWITENDSLTIGYLNNYLPYSGTDKNGNVTGILKDIVPQMLLELSLTDLKVNYVGYDNYDEMVADVGDEKIDAAFPVGGGLYYSEENGIYQSSAVVTAYTDLIYKDEYDLEDVSSFSVNENNSMQYYYIRTNFPNAEIVSCPDVDSALKAVLKENVGATVLNGLRAGEILKNSKYEGLKSKQLSRPDDRCFGVMIGNEGLLKLLNRGIKVLGSDYSAEIAYKYSGELYRYTLLDRVRDNLWMVLSLSLVIALLVIVLVIRDLRHTQLANKMKTDFVSNMSHEIRTPITAILGMNEMIQLESGDPSILRYADNIEKAGESLLGIINDILDFSKIEAGRMELNKEPYLLSDLLNSLFMMIGSRAREKNLDFVMDIDERLPHRPIGDVQKLRQVTTNLLSNAVKYTKEGTVELGLKLLDMDENSFTMEVLVKDTGIGIKPEEMDKLYSAFERLDFEKTKNIEGSGLGLAISQRLLSLMDSEIEVESEYGKGSLFHFVIKQGISDKAPIGPFKGDFVKVEDANKMRRKASFKAPNARLLLVDDTPMNLQVIKGLLKGNDLQIDTAESGKECIELFKDNSYDMVFLDQRMPIMDGVDTLHELKKLYPDKSSTTPIICLTANVLSGGRDLMIGNGFTDYLTKPVSLFEMEQMILKYLPKEKVIFTDSIADPGSGTDAAVSDTTDIDISDPAADLSDEYIPDAIKTISGLDIEKGIDYCGDAEEYMEALKIYASSKDEKILKLKDLLQESDIDGITLLTHSIKSTSKAIGAMELSKKAEAIEKTGKDLSKEELSDKLLEFIEDYQSLGDRIEGGIK